VALAAREVILPVHPEARRTTPAVAFPKSLQREV
jgi:hypothetical protein